MNRVTAPYVDEDEQDRYIEARAMKACPMREPCFLYGVCYAEKNGRPDLCDTETKP